MKVCIVGEGPVGLLTAILFIFYKKIYLIQDLNIFFYKSRRTFQRRHVVNVTKNIMKKIEKLITNCNNCLLQNVSENQIEQIKISINCLETILYTKLDNSYITIFDNIKFDSHQQSVHEYDHVFLCDGYSSTNRRQFIHDGLEYSTLKCVLYNSILLVLYTNLRNIDEPISDDCIQEVSLKKMFTSQYIYDDTKIEFDKLSSFIMLVYNINIRYNALPIIEGIHLKQKNIWSVGFTNYTNFVEIFDKTLNYINQVDSNSIIRVFRENDTNITDITLYLLDNKSELSKIYDSYKTFLQNELSKVNGMDSSFMIHTVIPNFSSHGIILDESINNLLFAKQNNNYFWLLGDSANSYPPGFSLMFGLIDSFFLISNFITFNFSISTTPESEITSHLNIFSCIPVANTFTENNLLIDSVCRQFSDLKFVGGYAKSSDKNLREQNISEVIAIINSKTCEIEKTNPNDVLLNLYNKYQLNNFFYNLKKYICNLNAGGKKKRLKIKTSKKTIIKIKTSKKNKNKNKTKKYLK